jgi:hypothetical protein
MEKLINLTPDELVEYKADLNKYVELAEALNRLHYNSDFKTVFLDHYLMKEPARIVGLLGEDQYNVGGKKAEHREDIHEMMIGISRFSQFCRRVFQYADSAKKSLDDLREAEAEFYASGNAIN